MKYLVFGALFLLCCSGNSHADSLWHKAESHGRQSQEAIRLCYRYAYGWLSQSDPKTGLLPRNLTGHYYWNSWDAAADNYPFLALTAFVTDQYHLKHSARNIMQQEKRLCSRVGALPWTYDFAKADFVSEVPEMHWVIFGAAEYAKDGLMPMTEFLGKGVWLDRMQDIVRGVWEQAPVETPRGMMPTTNVEVDGDLLQVMSRLYWITGKRSYKRWCYRIADEYLLYKDMLSWDRIPLRDHGCEIIGGLSETYLIAAQEDPKRRKAYQKPLRAVLDRILEIGVNADGMMPNGFNPKTGEKNPDELSDGWGYVYNAFLTVAQVDDEPRYREAVSHVLANVHKYLGDAWEGTGADGYADSVEGALNLLNRLPDDTAFTWVDETMPFLFDKQRSDGILEGWHGDGNSARTSLMYALWKTQGVSASPWREDLQLGSVLSASGTLLITLKADWAWQGTLRLDRPRHRDYLHLPM
ncbi:MAG TPA: hypothetical protein PKH07_12305, partial [bacterium]|nr:hypothetical protein [bacterium]